MSFGALLPLLVVACGSASEAPASTSSPAQALPRPAKRGLPWGGATVHLSVDDVPLQIERTTPMPLSPSAVKALNEAVLAGLGATPASAFVVCDRLQEGDETLLMWRAAGHTIGNHTQTHVALKHVGADAWLRDARACHDTLHARLGQAPKWMRYPYLDYGVNREQRDAVTAGLAAMGERSAPVTVATSEWMFAYAYRRAVAAGDAERQRAIVADFHRHMDAALEEGLEMAAEVPGRNLPQVVLVHLNELVRDEVARLIQRWRARGVRFVGLEEAMADPVFQRTNHWTTGAGISWLKRIRTADDPPRRYWFGEEEGRVVARWGPMPIAGEE
ncbi:MAG: polysaccharide deacetylase family protein [Myxococcota bacterium]